MRLSSRRVLATALALLVIGALAACGQESEQPTGKPLLDTYVGAVDGAPVDIAFITDGARVAGFYTDGKEQAKWFATEDLDDGKATLWDRDGFEIGEVEIADDVAEGELVLETATRPFQARLSTGNAGLLTAAEQRGNDSFEAGWITLPDGSSRGTYDTYVAGVFSTHPAPRLKPTVAIPGFGSAVPHQQTSLFLDANTQAP